MTSRTRIAIIGTDPSAFHVFQTIYKSDDRFEVLFFIDVSLDRKCSMNKYPAELSGPGYPSGIHIIRQNPFQNTLTDKKIEKCVFSPFCVTSSMYLYLAAQCLAAECTVITHALETTRIPPPKALVSFFADTQFHSDFLLFLLDHYISQKLKPLVVFPAPLESFGCDLAKDGLYMIARNPSEVGSLTYMAGNHEKQMCERIIHKCPICYAFDLEQFAADSLSHAAFDLIVFVGLNSLPCFFQSHLVVYACDDFTFGEDMTHHPSFVLLQQADVILVAGMKGEETAARISEQTEAQTVQVLVEFTGKDQCCYRDRPVLLLDDWYSVFRCNAVSSISLFLAQRFGMKPIATTDFGGIEKWTAVSPIYGEPTEKHWPALVVPDRSEDVTVFADMCSKVLTEKEIECKVIVSSTPLPQGFNVNGIPLMMFTFNLKMDIPQDVLNLPPAAFVKQRGGRRGLR